MKDNKYLTEGGNLLKLTVTHATYGKHGFYHGSNRNPCNRLFFIYSTEGENGGYVRHFKGDETIHKMVLKAGNIYFMSKNIDLEFRFEEGLGIIAFHFNIEAFVGLDLFDGAGFCRQISGGGEVFNKILNTMEHTDSIGDILQIQSVLLHYAGIFCNLTIDDIRHFIILKNKYSKIIELLEKRASVKLSVGEIAERMNMSRDMLSKTFRKDIGIPLKTYLTKHIVQKATEYLIYSGKRISEIAEELDFSNEYYFSKYFKKHKGLSPLRFRQKNSV